MKTNLLSEKLPYTVVVDGEEHAVDPSARSVLKSFELAKAENTPGARTLAQLNLFYKENIPIDIIGALEAYQDFFAQTAPQAPDTAANEPPMRGVLQRPENAVSHGRRNFDFDHDNALIYAAFVQAYGITDPGSLHWYAFNALFAALPDDCLFSKVVGWRTMTLPPSMSREEKSRYRKLKWLYALPDERTQEERDAEIAAAFLRA